MAYNWRETTRKIRKEWLDGPKIEAITDNALQGDLEESLIVCMDDQHKQACEARRAARCLRILR